MNTNIMDIIKYRTDTSKEIADVMQEIAIKELEIAKLKKQLITLKNEYENFDMAIENAMFFENE